MMAKKKTKWNRTHMFKRRKRNKNGVGHPAYIYGKSGRNFKFLVFTHKPEIGKEDEYEKLKHNIDPIEDGKRDAYVKKKFAIDRYDAFRDPDRKYRIHPDDVPTIKKFKK